MQTYNSFNELAAAQAASPLHSAMSVFNGLQQSFDRMMKSSGEFGVEATIAEFVADIEQEYGTFDVATLQKAAAKLGVTDPKRFNLASDVATWDDVVEDFNTAIQVQGERTGFDDDINEDF